MENVSGEAPAVAPSDYVAEGSFDDLGLSEPLLRAVAERGYTRPTPVQVATYRPVRDGKDVIVRSKTGTGKTAAFALPILEQIPDGRRKPSALVMCPTRELALQVADEISSLAKHRDLTVVTIYGGASMGDQLDELKAGAEIVVGTPGRIYDHIRRKTLRLDDVLACCLDEADEMLNMGFFEEVTRILDHLPDDCQQLLFSATVPADIEQIIREYLTQPKRSCSRATSTGREHPQHPVPGGRTRTRSRATSSTCSRSRSRRRPSSSATPATTPPW